ncbi:hypothetical protein LDENG_00194820, partial [Lucifuga dentata]
LLGGPKPRLKLKGDRRAFVVAALKLWNSLPLQIKTAPTLVTFKSHLLIFLFGLLEPV